MKSRRIYSVISQFNREVHAQFGEFIRSPLHNGQKVLVEIWELMEEKLLKEDSPDMSPEAFFALLRPGKKFNYGLLTKNLSTLLSKFHEFLVWLELKNHPESMEKLLLKAYRRAMIKDELPWLYKRSKKKILETEDKSATYFAESFEFELEMGHHLFSGARNPYDLEDFFKSPDESLNHYYFIRKLQMAIGVLSYNRAYNKDYAISHLDWVLETIRKSPETQAEATLIYFNAFGLYRDYQDREQFLGLKQIILNPELAFDKKEHQSLIALLLNVCFKNLNRDKRVYELDAEEIFDFALANQTLLKDDKLNPADLKNIIHLKCIRGKTDEAQTLLEEYQDQLEDDHEGYAQLYNQGQISFARGDFQECFRLMYEVTGGFKDDVFYSLDGRVYMIKSLIEKARIHLEKGDLDFIDTQIKNYLQYVDRFKKISETLRLPYRNFGGLVKKYKLELIDAEKMDASLQKDAIQQISEMRPLSLSNRRWLLEMVKS